MYTPSPEKVVKLEPFTQIECMYKTIYTSTVQCQIPENRFSNKQSGPKETSHKYPVWSATKVNLPYLFALKNNPI